MRQRCWSRSRAGLTVLELLVAIAVVGVMAGILLPALGAARESARRISCVSHLREIGLALHQHHNDRGTLPAGWTYDPNVTSMYGWLIPTLPYIGESSLSDSIRIDRPIAAGENAFARETSLSLLLCPSDLVQPNFDFFRDEDEDHDDRDVGGQRSGGPSFDSEPLHRLPTANYVGVFGTIEPDDEIPAPLGDGPFLDTRPVRFRDFLRGTSKTFLVGERTMAQVPSTWLGASVLGEDPAARIVGSALEGINNPLADECDFSSRHPGGSNFLWGDGHVRFVDETIDLKLYHEAARLRIQP